MTESKRFFEIYDENKLTEEDRRLVFKYMTDSALFNASIRLKNSALFLAVVSMLISSFSLVYSVSGGLTFGPSLTGIINIIIFILFLSWYWQSNQVVNKLIQGNVKDHHQISEKHFEYAKRSK